jgi:hypothetical protein
MAIEEYGGVVWTSSHFPQVDVFEHVVGDADVHGIYSYLPCSSICVSWLANEQKK